ncbi:RICIN domain-containing protein [Sorangium sp. So ce513]|uniref:RICIN domain-containing protein n=1 Tax=Sorangium sp. So ce513 TaxID=3133315 RepID=UPI003F62FE8A
MDTLRARTVDRPALYHLRSSGNNCAIPNGSAQPTLGTCDDSARWYLEPVGFGERLASVEFDFHGLLLVKPHTDIPGVTQGSLPTSVVDAVQVAFEERLAYWMDLITDGRVAWHGSSVVSNDPITSLQGSGDENYLPAAIHLQQDVQDYVPRGEYDTVQVVFTPGDSKPGGWGWGPGSSYASNYTLWTTVNGKYTTASQWLSTVDSEPVEVFIHEPMHGLDAFYAELGIPLPDGELHASAPNRYAKSGIPGRSFLHWYRDYWLGTVIAADDTYRGYGPRAFSEITPRDYALSPAVDEYKIVQHTSGKCFAPEGGAATPADGTPLVLSSSCSTLASSFSVLASGLLKHVPSGLCVHPDQGTANNNVDLILFPHCAPEERLSFNVTSGGSLQNGETGRCVHPLGGSATPAEGTKLIFHDGCDEGRLRFDLVVQ